MAYERQNWVDGITICNAERMNHIENGIKENSDNLQKTMVEDGVYRYFKQGNIVEIRIGYNDSVTVQPWEEKILTTIPEQYRPSTNVYFALMGYGATTTLFGTITPQGTVKVTNWTSDAQTATNIYADKVYFV